MPDRREFSSHIKQRENLSSHSLYKKNQPYNAEPRKSLLNDKLGVRASGPLSLAPIDRAILSISPTIPDAVFAESERGPCTTRGLCLYLSVWNEK